MAHSPGFYEALAPPELGSQAIENPNEGFAGHISTFVDAAARRRVDPPIAGRMRRMMAKLFDATLITGVFGGAMVWWGYRIPADALTNFVLGASTIGIAGAWATWFVYNWFCLGIFGATLGKGMIGMSVRRKCGARIGFWKAFARTWAESVSAMLGGLGYLIAIFDPRRKRTLHDHLCGTIVIMR